MTRIQQHRQNHDNELRLRQQQQQDPNIQHARVNDPTNTDPTKDPTKTDPTKDPTKTDPNKTDPNNPNDPNQVPPWFQNWLSQNGMGTNATNPNNPNDPNAMPPWAQQLLNAIQSNGSSAGGNQGSQGSGGGPSGSSGPTPSQSAGTDPLSQALQSALGSGNGSELSALLSLLGDPNLDPGTRAALTSKLGGLLHGLPPQTLSALGQSFSQVGPGAATPGIGAMH
jgi:hypothetical protein